jgi:uncharacterized protein YndB with AHSA1/START domain
MNVLKLSIEINKPAQEVFEFALNPKNTPKWIDFIAEEETNEWPVHLGTIYRNRGDSKAKWSEYELTEYQPTKSFTMRKKDGSYHVRYLFTPINNDTTRLDYFEWTDEGEIEEPFTMGPLQKLKSVVEAL